MNIKNFQLNNVKRTTSADNAEQIFGYGAVDADFKGTLAREALPAEGDTPFARQIDTTPLAAAALEQSGERSDSYNVAGRCI